jgi:hypothetical protein
MPNKINSVPPKRPEAETPTTVDERHPSAEEKMLRSADRLAHEANGTQPNNETYMNEFSSIGLH